MRPIISVEELFEIYKNEDTVIVDVSNSTDALENYIQTHLEKSHFVDLNEDLANIEDPKFGGRHPLPRVSDFIKVISRLGIHKNSRVIVYDNHYGANAASRFWWMLKSIKHENVQVLDGGFQAAIKKKFPTTTIIPNPANSTDYDIKEWNLPLVNIDEVRNAINNEEYLIIDVRDQQRFDGHFEPIDVIAGHIPSAINIPYKSNLNTSGFFKNPAELRELYSQKSDSKIILHCGSGVTACHTLLAFAIAGLKIPHLYVGSWSEWSRN